MWDNFPGVLLKGAVSTTMLCVLPLLFTWEWNCTKYPQKSINNQKELKKSLSHFGDLENGHSELMTDHRGRKATWLKRNVKTIFHKCKNRSPYSILNVLVTRDGGGGGMVEDLILTQTLNWLGVFCDSIFKTPIFSQTLNIDFTYRVPTQKCLKITTCFCSTKRGIPQDYS